MNTFLVKAQSVFFDAMLEGWANPAVKKVHLIQFPESKAIRFESDKFRVLDYYLTNPDAQNSMGNIVIWRERQPIWMMSYGGRYSKESVPFLKKALLAAYQSREFFGGRGPQFFEDDTYMYVNSVLRNDFTSFLGEERIFEKATRRVMGSHHYWGMGLTFHT